MSASRSPYADSNPVRPSSTISTVPPSSRATTGLPIAIASQNTSPNGSSCDGITKTSAAASSSSMSSRRPSSLTLLADAEVGGEPAEVLGVVGPRDVRADDQQLDGGQLIAQPGDGLDDRGRALLGEQPADRDEQRGIGRDPEALAARRAVGVGMPALDVDPVGDDADPRRVHPAGDERRTDVLGDGHQHVGVGERPLQHPAHPGRVVADVDVDDRAGAGQPAEHDGHEGVPRSIAGVDDLDAAALDQHAQPGDGPQRRDRLDERLHLAEGRPTAELGAEVGPHQLEIGDRAEHTVGGRRIVRRADGVGGDRCPRRAVDAPHDLGVDPRVGAERRQPSACSGRAPAVARVRWQSPPACMSAMYPCWPPVAR